MNKFFGANGLLASDSELFVFRKEQLEYAKAVSKTIESEGVGIVEGGTGVGKTLGYLIPHIEYAKQFGGRILIATRTKNLQDQIFRKDLPLLKKYFDFNFALLKGRENYICRGRLKEALERSELFKELDYYHALKVLEDFDEKDETGDIESAYDLIAQFGKEGRMALNDVRATDDTCTSDHRNFCRHYRALRDSEKSLVIVANHHLALLWPQSFPEVRYAVFDEAHSLEDAATDLFGPIFSTALIRSRLRRLYSREKKSITILSKFSRAGIEKYGIFEIVEIIEELKILLSEFDSLTLSKKFDSEIKRRIKDQELISENWSQIVDEAKRVETAVRKLSREIFTLQKKMEKEDESNVLCEKINKSALSFEEYANYAENIFRIIPVDKSVLWYESFPDRPITYRRSPINVGPMLVENVYNKFHSVILTSATMQVSGEFSFMEERLGIISPETDNSLEESEVQKTILLDPCRRIAPLSVGHPFDYKDKVLLCLVREESENSSEPLSIAERIMEIAKLTQGRMLALFTNKLRMLEVKKNINLDGIDVLAQYEDGSRYALVRRLKSNPNTVLLGTRSFWEGIDVPGENLSVVVIEKIPFTSPGEPLYDARCEGVGKDWFMRYALPTALLTLRQGFGRLIRKEDDSGIVVILNPGKKSYISKILRTLPECKKIDANFESVLAEIKEWWAK